MYERQRLSDETRVLEPETTEPPKPKLNGTAAFANDVLKLSLGTAFVQVENFLVSIVFARLYQPADFGVSALFTSITGVLAVIIFMRYESAMMLPKTREESSNILFACLLIGVTISLGLIPVMYFGRSWIVRLLNAPELGPYLWLIPLSTLMMGLNTLFGFWCTRSRRFLRQSTNDILNQVVTDGSRFGLAVAGQATGGSLIVGNLFGTLVANVQMAWLTWRDDRQMFRESFSFQQILAGIKRYKKFPLITSWAALLNSASTQMPSFLLAAFFSTTVTGYYGVGQRVLRLPVTLIGSAIGQVFYQRAATARHEGGLAKLVEETSKTLIIFGMFPMLLLTVAGREIFVTFFGAKWAEAGVYSQILGLWTFFLFISSPLSSLTNLHERQEIGLLLNAFLFITRVASLVVGGLAKNIYLGLGLFTASGILAYGWFSLWATSASGVPVRRTLRHLAENLLFSAPFLGAVAASKWILHWSPILVVAVSVLVGVLYYAVAIFRDPAIKDTFMAIFRKYFGMLPFKKPARPE